MKKWNSKIGILPWHSYERRNEIALEFQRKFVGLIRATGMVENDPFVKLFRFVRGTDLLSFERLPRFQEIKERLVPYSEAHDRYFVSHRWLASSHPDPEGKQLRLIQKGIHPEQCYWIDYCCLPQEPMTEAERSLVKESLQKLPSLMYNMNFIVLRCGNDGYYERAWCFFEIFAANVLGYEISYRYESELARSDTSLERVIIRQSIFDKKLPSHLKVTNQTDLILLEQLTEILAMFFELRVIEHYMMLGQYLAGEEIFWSVGPYYFLATCDFSKVLNWVFWNAWRHDIRLVELRLGYHDEHNIFVKIAERERFRHSVNVLFLPKKVTRSLYDPLWFFHTRKNQGSAHNLFFIITSMIE